MTDYIKNLRKIVGTRPLLQCGATVVVLNPSGQVLMLRRTDNKKWCFPGGSIELGERAEEAARRETLEEAGIQTGTLNLLNVFSGPELYYKYPHGDEVYNVDIVYHTDQYIGDIIINDESSEHAFFTINDIPEDVSPPQLPIVEYLKQKNALGSTAVNG